MTDPGRAHVSDIVTDEEVEGKDDEEEEGVSA